MRNCVRTQRCLLMLQELCLTASSGPRNRTIGLLSKDINVAVYPGATTTTMQEVAELQAG